MSRASERPDYVAQPQQTIDSSPAKNHHSSATQSAEEGQFIKQTHGSKAGEGTQSESLASSIAGDRPLHAVVIGINEYESSTINNLKGAVADADAMDFFLRTRLHVPAKSIVNLRDSEATRAAILNALHALLSPERAIRKNDAILIFFAGHGSSCDTPKGWTTGSGRISLIVPHDSKISKGRDQICHDIPDRTLGAILHKLSRDDATGKGNNITVILDCCFAGSGTRPTQDPLRVERGFELDYTIPSSLDQDIWDEDARAMEVVSGFANTGSRSHVLLAACRESQRAREGPAGVDTKYPSAGAGPQYSSQTPFRGLFTTALLRRLDNEATDQTTYEDLILGLMNSRDQTPQCEGHNAKSVLFKGLIPSTGRRSFPVSLESGRYIVEAGYAHGVSDGAFFSIFETGKVGDDGLLLVVEASTVRPFRTALSDELSGTFPVNMSAIPASAGVDEALLLHVPDLPELEPVLAARRAELALTTKGLPIIELADQLERAHLATRSCADSKNVEYFIQLPNLVRLSDLAVHRLYRTTQADARLVQPVLRAAARFAWHLRRERGHGRLRSNVVVQVFKTEEDQFGDYDDDLRLPFKPVGGDLLSDGRVRVVADRKTPYGIHVSSKFNVPLHIWAFYFDCSDLSITEYYKPAVSGEQAEPSLPARGTITLGYGASGGRPYRYYLREDTKEDIGFIKLFVSTKYIDLSHIQQVSPFSADDPVVAMDSAARIEVDGVTKWTAESTESSDRAAIQAPPPAESNPEGMALVWDVITMAVIQTKPDL